MKTFELEDTSVEEALNNFIVKSGYSRDFIVGYEIIDNGSKGFLGFGKKTTKIKITVDDEEFIKRKSKILLGEILKLMNIDDFAFETTMNKNEFIINILSKEANIIIGKNAQHLDAIQHILDKMLKNCDSKIKVSVDVEGYRQKFLTNAKDKIDAKISYVLSTGRRQKLNPMVPILRKAVHDYIKSKRGVKSESSGEGLLKTIYIYPYKRNNRQYKNV